MRFLVEQTQNHNEQDMLEDDEMSFFNQERFDMPDEESVSQITLLYMPLLPRQR